MNPVRKQLSDYLWGHYYKTRADVNRFAYMGGLLWVLIRLERVLRGGG